MARKKKKVEGSSGSPAWMATYGDLVTLLLCFFVLLFSMSTIDNQKFKAIITSMKGSLGVLDSGIIVEMKEIETTLPGDVIEEEQEEFKKIYQELKDFLEENGLDNSVTLSLDERGLLIRFLDTVLFDFGRAEIKDEAKYIINMISDVIKDSGKPMRIEGHTDNVPISTSRFPSNWELSTTRAVNVVKYVIELNDIEPWRISAAGYGEYHPIDTNETSIGRQNNRRVDIVILRREAEEVSINSIGGFNYE
ncbi:MAG: OmpA family protein [Firmicutes bacterium]|nr:OmpA family protein [Bacillota bacterium]